MTFHGVKTSQNPSTEKKKAWIKKEWSIPAKKRIVKKGEQQATASTAPSHAGRHSAEETEGPQPLLTLFLGQGVDPSWIESD